MQNTLTKHFDFSALANLIVVTGHYGVGKTNFSLNLALSFAEAGEEITLVDLDIVNPYFRSSDHVAWLSGHGIAMIAPTFAGTTVEAPVLPPEMYAAFTRSGRVIIDVGGDDAGATALGTYSKQFEGRKYDLLYVINKNRNLTQDPVSAAQILAEIEAAAKLQATGIVLNTHLQKETDCAMIADSANFANRLVEQTGVPLVCVTLPAANLRDSSCVETLQALYPALYPVKTLVLPPWE